jgi:hypothetical protein
VAPFFAGDPATSAAWADRLAPAAIAIITAPTTLVSRFMPGFPSRFLMV